MYHTYTTRAFVVEQFPVGEADMLCMLYTEDFGLIRAKAQGLRNEHSKLRYSIQSQNISSVSLVRGHSEWRVVGAVSLGGESMQHVSLFARVLKLVTRLVKGEEKDTHLFSILTEAHQTACTVELPVHAELVGVCKILIALGYVPKDILPVGEASIMSDALDSFMLTHRTTILKSVNDALQHSHL
jgi:recombinational DNA repair protein (RecF pathway)